MRKHLSLFAAASLAVGGIGWLGHVALADDANQPQPQNPDQQQPQPGQTGQQVQPQQHVQKLPQGVQKSQKDDSNDIRKDLGTITEALITKGDLDKFISYFSDADRARLEGYFRENRDKLADLNGRIAQIQADWRAKYNQKFELKGDVVFGPQYKNFEIVQGEVNNPAMLSNWPVPNEKSRENRILPQGENRPQDQVQGENRPQVQPQGQGQAQGQGQNPDIKQGREVAVVTFPDSHGLGDLNVSLIKETGWRIDVPNDLDGQRLYAVLLNNLTNFGEMKDHWPADVNEAYRTISHYVLMSCYNIPAPKVGGEMKEGMDKGMQEGRDQGMGQDGMQD